MTQLRLNGLPRAVARQSRWGVYARTVLLIAVSVLALAGCAESLTNCKGGNLLLLFSPISDFACPEQPTDTVGDVGIEYKTTDSGAEAVTLSWTNPSQLDLSQIEIRWSIATATDVPTQEELEPIVASVSLNQTTITSGATSGIIRLTDIEPGQVMEHTIEGIIDGTTYRFAISAIDQNGNISTVQDVYRVAPPTGLTAIFEDVQVQITWDAVAGATEYYVYRAVGTGSATRILTNTSITAPAYIDTDVSRGRSYRYIVRAVIRNGDAIVESANSNTVDAITPTTASLWSVHHANGRWIAVGNDGTVITSTNGTTWTSQRTSQTSLSSASLFSVHHANGTWVTMGFGNHIFTSANSTTWTSQTPGASFTVLLSVHHANGRWIAVGRNSDDSNNNNIITSTNGTTWTRQTSLTTRQLSSVHQANGTWVAVGGSGTIITSTNGTSWTSQTSGTGNYLRSVHHANGTWVAVGDSGRIITSTNGTTWTRQTSPPMTNSLNSVHHANGTWIAVGDDGIIITSTNGTTWTIQTSLTANSLQSVHHANGTWVAVGGGSTMSTIITSTNGTSWTSQTSPTTNTLQSVHHASGRWVTVGAGGTIITSTP